MSRLWLAPCLLVALALPAGAGDLTVKQVWPQKLCYRPGETATLTATVANTGAQAVNASVELTIAWGLDSRDRLPAQAVTVPAKGEVPVTFAYPLPPDRKWGHEALVTVSAPPAEPVTGREFFTVGTNPWEVGHYITIFGMRDRCPTLDDVRHYVLKTRKSYITVFEAYTPFPSYGDGMVPTTEIWRSAGDSFNRESKAHWQELVRASHENGMGVVTYIQCTSSGPQGSDFVRRHPEWFAYNKEGRMPIQIIDVDALTAARNDPEGQTVGIRMGGYYHSTFLMLPTQAHLGDWWIDQLIKSVELFGWDGFRSDGNPGFTSGYDVNGRLQEAKDLGALNAGLLRKIRTRLTARFPNFLYGWNNVAGGYPTMSSSAEEQAVMLPDAYSLFEHFNNAPNPGSVYHPWKKAAFYLQQEAQAVREGGGFAHAGWMPSNRYLEAVASASGQHIDTWSNPANYRQFDFRWSEFLWDNRLRFVRPGSDAVKVEGPAGIWWEDLVNARDLPGDGRRVIVHLINLPENDDDGWADKPPPPVETVKVTFAVPAGMRLTKLGAISPDVPGDVIPVTPAADGSVIIPAVTLWTVVVAEFK